MNDRRHVGERLALCMDRRHPLAAEPKYCCRITRHLTLVFVVVTRTVEFVAFSLGSIST